MIKLPPLIISTSQSLISQSVLLLTSPVRYLTRLITHHPAVISLLRRISATFLYIAFLVSAVLTPTTSLLFTYPTLPTALVKPSIYIRLSLPVPYLIPDQNVSSLSLTKYLVVCPLNVRVIYGLASTFSSVLNNLHFCSGINDPVAPVRYVGKG
jgi:hypothetical protein